MCYSQYELVQKFKIYQWQLESIAVLKITVRAGELKGLAYLESHGMKMITSGKRNGGMK